MSTYLYFRLSVCRISLSSHYFQPLAIPEMLSEPTTSFDLEELY